MKHIGKFCIIGIPDHEAVSALGGRVGAAHGPEAFRRAFSRMRSEIAIKERGVDLGDVPELSSHVRENHLRAAQVIADHVGKHMFSVIVGGSHDHGYSQLKGIREGLNLKRIGCINVDAHLDLRSDQPRITSGSPFFIAIESGVLAPQHFIEFGVQRHCNSEDLWQYARSKKIRSERFEDLAPGKRVLAFKKALKTLAKTCDGIVVSFDLDACSEAFAPGVSAPQADGFSASEALEMIRIAGREKKVVSLGLFELNPLHDRDDQTARLAAQLAYHFAFEKF